MQSSDLQQQRPRLDRIELVQKGASWIQLNWLERVRLDRIGLV